MRLRRGLLVFGVLLASGLGCSAFSPTNIATPTPFQVVIIVPNETPVPSPTPTITLTATETTTPVPTSTATPLPTATPTITLTPSITLTPTITLTPSITLTPTITNTPAPSATPDPIESQVCKTCKPRLRETPGTAGKFLGWLDETIAFTAFGRTDDGKWIQVLLKDDKKNRHGWVVRELTDLRQADISQLPVTGTTVDATEVPVMAANVPGVPGGVISGVTAKSREIFLKGQTLGNRANVFTRVGDSITASPYFLTPIGLGQYDLGEYHNQLIEVVGFYLNSNAKGGANSFVNASYAAGNGWGADRILQPGYSHPEVCGGDSPLVCEYKNVKPAVALIMIGTNDSGGVSPAEFEGNLRRIVEISIEMGVIPVLNTIPPKMNTSWDTGRAIEWNGVIRMVARQYDVPLIDLYTAMQMAPNFGLSDDGIHPSVPPNSGTGKFTPTNMKYGYTIRNLTALQALNAIWRQIMY